MGVELHRLVRLEEISRAEPALEWFLAGGSTTMKIVTEGPWWRIYAVNAAALLASNQRVVVCSVVTFDEHRVIKNLVSAAGLSRISIEDGRVTIPLSRRNRLRLKRCTEWRPPASPIHRQTSDQSMQRPKGRLSRIVGMAWRIASGAFACCRSHPKSPEHTLRSSSCDNFQSNFIAHTPPDGSRALTMG